MKTYWVETEGEAHQRGVEETYEALEKKEAKLRLVGRPARPCGWYNPDGRPLSADWKIKGFPPPVKIP